MRNTFLIAALAAFSLAPAAALAQSEETTTSFINAEGEDVGSATLTGTPNGLLIAIDVSGLPEGEHGFHIHETGTCDPATGFESAGGHLAGGREHGYMVDGGPHAGDMANVFVQEDGVLKLHVVNDRVGLSDGETPLLDDDGSALMIHAAADDYETQPSGDAGGRLACATLTAGG